MLEGIHNFPLTWPVTWPRTKAWHRKNALFADRSLEKARDFVLEQLRLLKAQNVIISTDVPFRKDGKTYSTRSAPFDPGAAVYFVFNNQPRVLACDKWRLVQDNLWAIALHIEAIRGMERWGVGTIDQAFTGYEALPNPQATWWEILGVNQDATAEEIRNAYRQKAKKHHPDVGGSNEEFLRIQKAYNQAQKEKGW